MELQDLKVQMPEIFERVKEDVKKVLSGYECGIRLEDFQDIVKEDILEFYEER